MNENNIKQDEVSIEGEIRKLMRHNKRGHHHGSGRGGSRHGRILGIIAHHEGLSSSELAEILDIRPSSVTEVLNKMEGEELIRKQKDEKDQRINRLYLEPAGKQIVEEYRKMRIENDPYKGILDEEETTEFIRLCRKLKEGMEDLNLKYETEAGPCDCGRVDGPCVCGKHSAQDGKSHHGHGGRGRHQGRAHHGDHGHHQVRGRHGEHGQHHGRGQREAHGAVQD